MLKDEYYRRVELGQKLRMYRMASELTQKQAAEKLGVSFSTVGMWETGKRVPSATKLQEILDLYDVELRMSFR